MGAPADSSGKDETAAAQSGSGDIYAPFSGGRLRSTIEALRTELGDQPELVKQALADFLALHRQHAHDHFEGRLEYARHITAQRDTAFRGLLEYGTQTFKWLFLLNAGSIAIVMAYVGAATGKGGGTIVQYVPLIRQIWPFALGCIAVTLGGATAYLNFCYYEATLATPETLNNFLHSTVSQWPSARFQKAGEPPEDFLRRYSWKVHVSRMAAITSAVAATLFFALGVYLTIRAAFS